jgi:hypothetical protein|tara:strand:- start:155 stop:1426 length:1272 start_codon:yes stop_codon:yes gene_type:complete
MNRIILIGNGFDLAHGMETSYRQFIDKYWEECINETLKLAVNNKYENKEIIIENRPVEQIPTGSYKEFRNGLKKHKKDIFFKNKFFEIISEKSHIQNWVDIENEYYSLLKGAFNEHKSSTYRNDVKTLNTDFNNIKNKLIEYLVEVETNFNKNLDSDFLRTKNIIGHKIYHPFMLKDFSESSLNQKAEIEYNLIKKDIEALAEGQITMDELNENKRRLIKKIDTKRPLAEIKKLLQSDSAMNYFDLIPDQTIFLNFNYTFTNKKYSNAREFDQFNDGRYSSVKSIHIHGTTDKRDNNPVIFGFGDEIDDDYKAIEKLNDNNYLENIKSINYLETDNYKKLLEYINSGNFQTFIFGHSCGISDRTLLNTIFEHENCASIKLYYHQKAEDIDNYSDIIRNVSRNFNDKAKMRDRVVNKNYCEQLR